ncbi:hypothetical protein [Streptomyces sp. NPDC058964]|uniref:hypothetical protein n=1 Tax=Streptomyces sp. NPDC058964 TaxID=3346681 RepID=UPI003681FA42
MAVTVLVTVGAGLGSAAAAVSVTVTVGRGGGLHSGRRLAGGVGGTVARTDPDADEQRDQGDSAVLQPSLAALILAPSVRRREAGEVLRVVAGRLGSGCWKVMAFSVS